MAQSNWEADKMLDVYIYDYLLKRNLHDSAKAFMAEGKVSGDPVAIDAPGGFLFEWWSVFWDIFIARTNEKHSEKAAAYIEAHQIKAREQHLQMRQLQIIQQRQAQLQRRDASNPSISGPINAILSDEMLGQSTASVLAAKRYEERMKHPHSMDSEPSPQLLEANKMALLRSASNHPDQLVQSNPGCVSAVLQQIRGQTDLKADINSTGTQRSLPMDPSSLYSQGVTQSKSGLGNGGLNQGGSGLPLKGWPLGIDQVRPSLGSQLQKPFVQTPNQFQLLSLQQQQQRQFLQAQARGSSIQACSPKVRVDSQDQEELTMKMQQSSTQQQPDQLQLQHPHQNNRKRQHSSSGAANTTGTGTTMGPSPNSQPSTPSTHTPGDGVAVAGSLQRGNNAPKSLMIYGPDGAGGLASSTDQLDDMEHFGDVGSLEDNVVSFLSHDGGDARDTFGTLKRSPTKNTAESSKGFSFNEVSCIRTSNGKVVSCHFSSDGKLLASAGHEKKAVIWNMDTLETVSTPEEHSLIITDIRFRMDSTQLATSSFDRTVRLWNAAEPNYCLHAYAGHGSPVMSLDFHPKKTDLFCSCDSNGEIRYWNASQYSCTRVSKGGIAQVRFQPRVGQFLAAAAENVVSIFDVESDRKTYSLQGHTTVVHSVCWDAKGDYLGDRHVRFSGKDEFMGHTKTENPSNKLPQVKNICEVFSDALTAPSSEDQLVEVDNNIPAMDEAQVVTESDIDVSISIMDGSEVQSVQHDRCLAATHCHDAPCPVIVSRNRVFHDMGSISLDMDLNQPLVHHDSLHLFNPNSSSLSHKLAGIPKSPNFVSKDREVGIQAEANVQRTTATSRCLGDSFAYPIPSSGMNSLANITRNGISQPSLSCSILNMGMNEKQPYLSSGVSPNSNGCPLHYQQLRCISQKDPTNSIRSSMVERKKHLPYKSGNLRESRSIMDPIFLRSGRCVDEDFIGLPLNSQGELISLHPSGKVGLKQVFKKQNMTMGSVGNFPIYNVVGGVMDHSNKKDRPQSVISRPSLKLFPEQNYLKNPMSEPASSALGFSVVKNVSRTRIQYDTDRENELSFHQLDPELHLMDSSYHGCTSSNQCHNLSEKKNDQSIDNSDGQPTLRLMGKNVVVGKSNKDDQDLEDGKVWTDKEVVTVQHPPDNCVQRCFPQERTACPLSRMFGKVDHLVESQSGPTLPNIFQMKPVEPSSASGYNCQTHLMSRNGLPLINGNHCSELPPVTHSLLNKASKFQKSCFSGTGFVKMSHQIPMQASSSHNYCLQHMLLNSTQSKQNPGPTLRETSDFTMSFASRDGERHGQPSCMQCSLSDSPQLLNAAQQKETLSYPSQPFNSFPDYHPCFMTGSNLLPLPSPYFTSMISSPSQRSNTSELYLQNPSSPASMAPPLIPYVPMLKPISAIKSSFRTRNKVMDSGRSKSAVSKDHDLSKKAKKRPADRANMSNGITKKPHLETLDSNAAMGSKKVQELQRYGEKMMGADLSCKEIVKDALGTASRDNAFKPDGAARLGPIKLSAGAKHILKPSQNIDQDNSRPTHSTLPCAVVTDTSKVPDFQKKLAKIYRF